MRPPWKLAYQHYPVLDIHLVHPAQAQDLYAEADDGDLIAQIVVRAVSDLSDRIKATQPVVKCVCCRKVFTRASCQFAVVLIVSEENPTGRTCGFAMCLDCYNHDERDEKLFTRLADSACNLPIGQTIH